MVISVRRRAALALVAAFGLGAAAGGGVVHTLGQRELARWDRDRTGRRVAALTRRLDLSREQQTSVAAIHERHREAFRRLGAEMNERCGQPMHQERTRLDEELKAILSPEQRVRYDEMLREQREPGPSGSAPSPP